MAAVAQLVEHSVVVRVVAGSNPVGRPIFHLSQDFLNVAFPRKAKAWPAFAGFQDIGSPENHLPPRFQGEKCFPG